MIAHVLARGMEADLGPVVVATDAREIAEAVEARRQAVMTAGAHACGLDRIGEALGRFDPARKYDVVVDLQGDQPFLRAGDRGALALLRDRRVDMRLGDIGAPRRGRRSRRRENGRRQISRIVCARSISRAPARPLARGRTIIISAFTFFAAGVRAIRQPAVSPLEKRERLEQLRGWRRHAHRRRLLDKQGRRGYGARPRRGAPGRESALAKVDAGFAPESTTK